MSSNADTDLQTYLDALFATANVSSLVELRIRRRDGGMNQQFFSTRALDRAATAIATLAARTDVYVGVVPRTRRAGGRDAVGRVAVLWADCDGSEACAALNAFQPAPTIVVRSSANGVHAYWLLRESVDAAVAEAANRRIAMAIGADPQSTDAARILRPPGTFNFKHEPPAPVQLLRATSDRFVTGDFDLPAEAMPTPMMDEFHLGPADPLRSIEPAVFIRVLGGLDAHPGRKVACPFHDDRVPSLHVYETPEGGWYCFGCGRGTSIYDFAAALWGLDTRGTDFLEVRRRLRDVFVPVGAEIFGARP